jgi:hypothetical protein
MPPITVTTEVNPASGRRLRLRHGPAPVRGVADRVVSGHTEPGDGNATARCITVRRIGFATLSPSSSIARPVTRCPPTSPHSNTDSRTRPSRFARCCHQSARRSAEPDDVAIGVNVAAFAFAVVLVLRVDDVHTGLPPVRREFVGVVNVDIEHG